MDALTWLGIVLACIGGIWVGSVVFVILERDTEGSGPGRPAALVPAAAGEQYPGQAPQPGGHGRIPECLRTTVWRYSRLAPSSMCSCQRTSTAQ